MSEKRNFSRVPFIAEIELVNQGEAKTCRLLDISLKGVLVEAPPDWEGSMGDVFQLSLRLPNSDVNVLMEAGLVHQESGRLGFKWESIELNDFMHLRRLLELNLGDESLVEREINALLENSSRD